MKPNLEAWTIVVTGLWNVRIFTPAWVATNAFEAKDIQTEIRLGAPAPSVVEPVSLRYRSGSLLLIPAFDRLIVGVTSPTDEILQQAEAVALRIVKNLPHTPMSAFGVNFAFIEEEPTTEAIGLFKLSDLSIIPYEIMQTEITRRLRLESGVLNLKHTFDQNSLRLDFNFHHDTPAGAEQVSAGLPGVVLKSRIVVDQFTRAYKLDIGEKDADAN